MSNERQKDHTESKTTKRRKNTNDDDNGDEKWYTNQNIIELPSQLHQAKTPFAKSPNVKGKRRKKEEENEKTEFIASVGEYGEPEDGVSTVGYNYQNDGEYGEGYYLIDRRRRRRRRLLSTNDTNTEEEEDEEEEEEEENFIHVPTYGPKNVLDSISTEWIEAKGGDISLLPENVKDLSKTDLAPFFASCYSKPAVLSRQLETIKTMILGDGLTLDACVLDKRYGDAYKMICINSCLKPNDSPQKWSDDIFLNTNGGTVRSFSSLDVKYDAKCHGVHWKDGECIKDMGRLNTKLPVCAEWYKADKEDPDETMYYDEDGEDDEDHKKYLDDLKKQGYYNKKQCQDCAKACVQSSTAGLCVSEQCRLGITKVDSNTEPYDYVLNGKLSEAFHVVVKRIRNEERSSNGYRKVMQNEAKRGKYERLGKKGLAKDPYGRALLRKVNMLENVATIMRIKSKSLMKLGSVQLVEEEKAMESLRSMRSLMLQSRRFLRVIENSGPDGQYPVITPDLLWSKIQTIYESSKNPMPMVNFLDSILLFKSQKFHLIHRVAMICSKEKERYMRENRLLGNAKVSNRKNIIPTYNGGRIYELPNNRNEETGAEYTRTGKENINKPEIEKELYNTYISIETQDDQLERSAYIMEMECRQQWMEVANGVDEIESTIGNYEAQTRSLLVREIGQGEVCSICTSMLTSELSPNPPTQISTNGWDKGTSSSTFAFCNGLDTATRKQLCLISVPYIMELAQRETEQISSMELGKEWQLRDSLNGLLKHSPLFTQYKYSIENNEMDQATKEPYALTASNSICKYLLSCERTYSYSELIKSSSSNTPEGQSSETMQDTMNAASNGDSPTSKIDMKSKASIAVSSGIDNAIKLLNDIKYGGDTLDKSKIEKMLQGQTANDQNIGCQTFTSSQKTYQSYQHQFDQAASNKQCYVCVSYIMELEGLSAERGDLDGTKTKGIQQPSLQDTIPSEIPSTVTATKKGEKGKEEEMEEEKETLLRFLELKEQATNKLKDTDREQETEQETEPTKYADVSETVCHHELFEGESSQNVIEDIKKKCDTSGIIGKLDGTNTGNAAGGDKEKSDSSTLLLEISSLMQAHDTKKGDGDSNEMIPSWFKTMVMKASSRQMTERTSCLGMQLTPKDIVAAEAAVSCLEIEFGAHTGGIQQPMSKKECIDVIGVVDSVVNQRLRHMAAAVGIMVPGDLSQAPRYLLYKQLVMKLYGTTGKVDDSAIPYDRSVTKDLPIRPMLPFCVDISMCPNIEIEKRMKRYFQVTHESGNPYENEKEEKKEGEKDASKSSGFPMPPGWSSGDASSSVASTKDDVGGAAAGGSKGAGSENAGDDKESTSKGPAGGEITLIEWNKHMIHHKSSGLHARAMARHRKMMKRETMSILENIERKS